VRECACICVVERQRRAARCGPRARTGGGRRTAWGVWVYVCEQREMAVQRQEAAQAGPAAAGRLLQLLRGAGERFSLNSSHQRRSQARSRASGLDCKAAHCHGRFTPLLVLETGSGCRAVVSCSQLEPVSRTKSGTTAQTMAMLLPCRQAPLA